jgi:hypothetical protein
MAAVPPAPNFQLEEWQSQKRSSDGWYTKPSHYKAQFIKYLRANPDLRPDESQTAKSWSPIIQAFDNLRAHKGTYVKVTNGKVSLRNQGYDLVKTGNAFLAGDETEQTLQRDSVPVKIKASTTTTRRNTARVNTWHHTTIRNRAVALKKVIMTNPVPEAEQYHKIMKRLKKFDDIKSILQNVEAEDQESKSEKLKQKIFDELHSNF